MIHYSYHITIKVNIYNIKILVSIRFHFHAYNLYTALDYFKKNISFVYIVLVVQMKYSICTFLIK